MFPSTFNVTVRPVSLGYSVIYLRMTRLKLRGSQPAANGFFILTTYKKTVTDIIIAQPTIRFYLLSQIKHLLGYVMLAHFGVGYYPITIARLESRVNFLDMLEGLNGLIISASTCIIDT